MKIREGEPEAYTSSWRKCSGDCPICGHRGWCSVTADGCVCCCRRTEDGCVAAEEDCNGVPYYVHILQETPSYRDHRQVGPPRADPQVLQEVYLALNRMLALNATHRRGLERRGLDRRQIDRRGYKTLSNAGRDRIAAQLAQQFGADTLAKVPGFYVEGGVPRLAGPVGLLIPVVDERRSLAAYKIRGDGSGDGPKYLYLSSWQHGGPGPGSPAHWPLGLERCDFNDVRITEGELKADISVALSGIFTIGCPGAACWRIGLEAASLGAPRIIRLAFDADAAANPTVAAAQLACARHVAASQGVELVIETWNPKHKGIDDLLAAGGKPRELRGAEALAYAQRIAERAGCVPAAVRVERTRRPGHYRVLVETEL